MASRIETPALALLVIGASVSVLTIAFANISANPWPGILLAYPAYWALDIRHALATRLYRRQAFGIGMVSIAYGFIFIYFSIVSSLPPGSSIAAMLNVLQPYSTVFVFGTTFYWVDSSVLAARRSDPLLRDTLSWGRIRRFAWTALLLFSALLIAFAYSSGFSSSIPNLVLPALAGVVLIPLISGVILLPIVAKRSRDPFLRRQLRYFGYFLASLVAITTLFQVLVATGPTGYPLIGYLSVGDIIFVGASYFLYKSARALVPLNHLENGISISTEKLTMGHLTSPSDAPHL